MVRIPGQQSRAVMQAKAQVAIHLYERGLTFRQITAQLNCSAKFLQRVITQHRKEQEQEQQEASLNGVELRSGQDRRKGRDRRTARRSTWDRRSGLDRRGHPFYQPRRPQA
jgi:hypothetical protein